ncbi:very short patch repair endonuclease [Qipengyuania aquimaris]|uniref:very short patch repair endonuclease n=1 Tax=Qipengyuania aquimaris TaxID=255984 RepID=UPI001FD3A6B7|nr:DNA mismatch endonuclease Vsr [Qipengyuania aquimaris]UOR15828.1 DNA mismatch endonuclease Vsr [Qipengyuania aquimaris]
MADIVDSETRSRMMSGIRGKDTKPELVLRRLLHRLGYRFRLHRTDLPGKPDIVLPKHRTVILVNGCFWHGHSHCHLFRLPKTRAEFWEEKISKNVERDQANRIALLDKGWAVLEVWECALKGKGKLTQQDIEAELVSFILDREARIGNLRGKRPA